MNLEEAAWLALGIIACATASFLLLELALGLLNPSIYPIFLTQDDTGTLRLNSYFEPEEKFAFFSFDKYYGWKNRNNTHGRFISPEFNIGINQNLQGMRASKNIEKADILVLGDSFAWGWGVEENETFYALIEREANKPVASLGVAAYGTAQELLQYKNNSYGAKTVILMFYEGNDFQDNYVEPNKTCFSKPIYYLENEELKLTNYPIIPCNDNPETSSNRWQSSNLISIALATKTGKLGIEIVKLIRDKALGRDVLKEYAPFLLNTSESKAKQAEITFYLLKALNEEAKHNNATLIVAVIPHIHIVGGSYQKEFEKQGWEYDERLAFKTIGNFGKEIGFETIDLYPGLKKAELNKEKVYYSDIHWTAKGHKIAAETILEAMQ